MSDPLLQIFERVRMAVPLSSEHTDELLTKLQGLVSNVSWTPDEVVELFNALLNRFHSEKTNDRVNLTLWLLKMLHCIEINYITPNWKSGKTLLELLQDTTVTDDQLEQILGANTEKTLDEILEEIAQQESVDKKVLADTKDIVAAVYLNSPLNKTSFIKNQKLIDILHRLVAAVKKTQNITPRLTQMVSWCLMALSAKGRLIQVRTGEGKTCIVAMFAAFRALEGHKVDIMSSSPVLAERDFDKWQRFYKELNISVSCNINKSNIDLQKCYKCQVVYGTSHEFAGDWLKHEFGRENIRGDRPFQCAIVDEVDSLMLDKGDHTVYMATDMPALIHLNPLLALIWDSVNQYTREGLFVLGPKTPFHQIALESVLPGKDPFTILQLAEENGTIDKGSTMALRHNSSTLPQILANVTPQKQTAFFKSLESKFNVKFIMVNNTDEMMKNMHQCSDTNNAGSTEVLLLHTGGVVQHIYLDTESLEKVVKTKIINALHFTPCDVRSVQNYCYIPRFLKDFVDFKLKDWIQKAFYAQKITQDHQYVIEKHGVVPVDYSSTGVIQNFMQWTDGLHQFLQIKHGQKLSPMSAVTNFMSNVGLLHMYRDQIYGVTGTLGEKVETETLQKIYNGITASYIPTFKRRKLFEVEGVIVNNEEEWQQRICEIIRAQISCTSYRSERAVLVICETISRAKAIHEALGPSIQNKALYISNNLDNRAITDNEIKAGQVIIATNLAGRGTDLRVSAEVNSAGGLFVLQTFLPENARVEAQAFGRTGRQGNPGSAQLVICSNHLHEHIQLLVLFRGLMSQMTNLISLTHLQDYFAIHLRLYQSGQPNNVLFEILHKILTKTSDAGIKLAKTIRDRGISEELKSYLECGIPKMKMKQNLFSQYLDFIDDFYKENNNQPTKSDVSVLHEFWGMWLLMNADKTDPCENIKEKLDSDLGKAKQILLLGQSPLSNLHHYTLFGNAQLKKGNFEASIEMFSKAIEEDRCWAAVAFYKRAFAHLIQQDNNQDLDCIDQALRDLHQARNSMELYCYQDAIVCKYSKAQKRSRFDNHQKVRQKLFFSFKKNIEEAIEKLTKAQKIGGHVKVEERIVHVLAAFSDYLHLPLPSLAQLWHRYQLSTHQFIYDFDINNEIEGLKSLGLSKIYVLDARWSLKGFISKLVRSTKTMRQKILSLFQSGKSLRT